MDRCVRLVALAVLVLMPFSLSCLMRSPDPHRVSDQTLIENSDPNNPAVYLGSFGNTYHAADCPMLKIEKYPITLKHAKRFYKPCLHCKPVR